jgi:hypothetical protein
MVIENTVQNKKIYSECLKRYFRQKSDTKLKKLHSLLIIVFYIKHKIPPKIYKINAFKFVKLET